MRREVDEIGESADLVDLDLGARLGFRLFACFAVVARRAPCKRFRLDEAQASALRLAMETQLASAESSFDIREFQRLDLDFHRMIARGSSNRFVGQALVDHLKLRRLPGALHGVNVFRLKQSTREHLAVLDQLEAKQFEAAADLIRLHLRLSRSQRPQAASRGAPVLPAMVRERSGR